MVSRVNTPLPWKSGCVAVSTARTASKLPPPPSNRQRMKARNPTRRPWLSATRMNDEPNGFSWCFQRKNSGGRRRAGPPPRVTPRSPSTPSSSPGANGRIAIAGLVAARANPGSPSAAVPGPRGKHRIRASIGPGAFGGEGLRPVAELCYGAVSLGRAAPSADLGVPGRLEGAVGLVGSAKGAELGLDPGVLVGGTVEPVLVALVGVTLELPLGEVGAEVMEVEADGHARLAGPSEDVACHLS